jgi:hypothetical protein
VGKVAVGNPTCGNVVHGPYYGGNYWLAYTGSDNDYDLLGDMLLPHRGYDNHPLIRAICGDVSCDGSVSTPDLIELRERVSKGAVAEPLNSEWAGDVNHDEAVSTPDLIELRERVSKGATLEPLHCCVCECS